MKVTRRDFIRGGVAAFTVSFGAPAFLSDLARAQGASRRNLVVLYLSGGNDALSTLIPYTDASTISRRPTIAVPAARVLQVGTDSSGRRARPAPAADGPEARSSTRATSRSSSAPAIRTPAARTSSARTSGPRPTRRHSTGSGWLGRYLDTLPSPVDPLAGWCTMREVPHSLDRQQGQRAGDSRIPRTYAFQSPNPTRQRAGVRADGDDEHRVASAARRPHLSFVNGTTQAALATLDRVARSPTTPAPVTYGDDGLSQAFRAVAGAIVRGIGTKVFWVTTGGYDTHATQNTNAANAGYANLMGTINTALTTFYNDLRNQGLLQDTLVLQFSEFGRRISENGSAGTDHGAAG